MKQRNHIELVPVWHERVDHRLYVLALLAFAEQLARVGAEKAPTRAVGTGQGGGAQ
jgi:hypothetical protein